MVAMNSEFDSFLLRTPMESGEEQDSFCGLYPEYGAIFMSSGAMKDECFKRRLFGLPSSQGQFVKQVKTGMILFLFEYERRELHGVFQACSDGERNISPSAYNSSRNQFPAQVKVKPIWRCHPLSESEFSGAIKDNYFSNWKFHFGLSKAQVRSLLVLFSSRKLKYQRRQGELAGKREAISVDTAGRVKEVDDGRSVLSDNANNELDANNHNEPTMARSPGNAYGKFGKEDGGMLASDKVGNLHKVDKKVGEIMQSEYLGPIPGEVGKLDAAFAMSERAGNEFNVDVESVSSEHPMSGRCGRGDDDLLIHDDSSCLMSDQLQIGNSEGNVFGPTLPSKNPAFFQSSLDRPVCPGMPVEETGSLIQDQTRSTSTAGHLMELPIASHSSASPSYRDAIVIGTLPYDPDALSLNNPCSPSSGVNQSSNSVQDCYKQHGIPSITNQSYTEPKGINQTLESTSKFDVHVPIASPDHYEHSCHGNIIRFPGLAYSEEMALDSSGKHCSGEPVLKNSLSPESLSQIGSSGRETKSPSSYSLCPSNCLSFVIDRAHHVALQEKLDQEMAQKLNDEPCTAHVTSSEELQCQLQCRVHPDDHSCVDHLDQKSFDHDLKSYVCSEGMCSDLKNQRSVFSHLTSDMPGKENSTHADYEETDNDASMDEVMAMLSASNYRWVKSKKSKRPTRWHDDEEKFRSNKKTKVDSELDSNYLELIPKKSNLASATRIEDKDDQRREQIPFVDFKRRSELRKLNGDTKARAKDESAGRLLGGQCKIRKLIRPNFNDNEPRDETSINGHTSLSLQASSQESSVSEDINGKRRKLVRPMFRVNEPCDDKSMNGNTSKILQVSSQKCSTSEESGSCEASVGSQGKLLPQGTDLLLVVCQSSHENEKTKKSSKYERETEVESSAASVNFGDEGRKEPLHDVGSQIADLAIPKLLLQCTESPQVVHEGLKELLHDVGSEIANLAIPKLLPQCTESPQVVHQSSSENENVEKERFPEYEQEIKTKISGPSLKIGDEGGMELLHDLGSLAIPYGDKNPDVQKDSDFKVPIVNKSSQDCNDSSHITVQKSALQLPEPNSGTENAFSEIRCARGDELDLLPRVELCPESGDLSISNVIGSSRILYSELQRGAKEVAICVEAGVGDNHHESSNKRAEPSLDTVGCLDKQEPSQEHRSSKLSEAFFGTVGCFKKPESSLEFRDPNLGFGEGLFVLSNSFKSSGVNASKNVGERRDALQISGSNACISSDIGTSENVEDTISKDLVPSRKCELKAAYNRSDIDTSKHVVDAHDSLPISSSTVCKSIGTSDNMEEREDVLASSGGIRKRVLKRAINRSKFDNSKHVDDVKDVHPISNGNVDKSVGTSENVEKRKVVFPSRVIIRKRVLKMADSRSKIDTSKHVDDANDYLPISGSNSCKSSDSLTSESVEERKDVLQSNVEFRKGELKTACNQDFEFGDDSETDDTKRESKNLWSILTARLKQLKNAQQTTVTRS